MKKNNLFKISLLLLVLNPTIIKSDELEACRDGVRNRGWQNGVPLITDSSQISGNRTHVGTIREKAAWIFGYNQNMTGYTGTDNLSYMWDNDNDIGVMFNPPAPVEFGAINGWGLNTRAWLGPLEVCVYGKKIGWAFDAFKTKQSPVLNFFKTSGAYSKNDMLGVVFGERFSGKTRGAYGRRNMLQNMLNSYSRIPNSACACTGFTDSSPFTRNTNTGLLE